MAITAKLAPDIPLLVLVAEHLKEMGFGIKFGGPVFSKCIAELRDLYVTHPKGKVRISDTWRRRQLYITIFAWIDDPHRIVMAGPDWWCDLNDPLSLDKLVTELRIRMGIDRL